MSRCRQWAWLLCLASLPLLTACDANGSPLPEPTIDPLVAQGASLFQLHCATCHATAPDTVIVGPSLAGIASRAGARDGNLGAAEYIQMSILRPGVDIVDGFADSMPKDFGKKLTGEEMDAVLAYLMTLE